jgi:hypothetical protein
MRRYRHDARAAKSNEASPTAINTSSLTLINLPRRVLPMQILLLANKFGAGLELRFLNSKCVDSDVRAPCSGASKQKLLLRYILTVSVFRSEPLALSLAGWPLYLRQCKVARCTLAK